MPLFTKQYKLVLAEVEAKQALHVTHWPRVREFAASAGVWLRAIETEISAALWATFDLEIVSFGAFWVVFYGVLNHRHPRMDVCMSLKAYERGLYYLVLVIN